jgi:hypothetical protein
MSLKSILLSSLKQQLLTLGLHVWDILEKADTKDESSLVVARMEGL